MAEEKTPDTNEELRQYASTLEKELQETNEGLVALTLEYERAEEKYRNIFENSIDGIFQINNEGKFLIANPAIAKMLGYKSSEELIECVPDVKGLYVVEERHNQLLKELEKENSLWDFESLIYSKNRDAIWISENIRKIFNNSGVAVGYESIASNITLRKQVEERLKLVAKVFGHSLEGIIITDEQTRLLEVNKAFTDITGYTAQESIYKTPHILFSGWQDKAFYNELWDKVKKEGVWQGEIKDRRKNGEIYVQWLTVCSIKNELGRTTNYIGVFSDITEKKHTEKQINKLAYYDVLTGLPNRSLFNDRLAHCIEKANRGNGMLAVIFIDLDNFKYINDTLGHFVGDQFLQMVSERMMSVIRKDDTVARLGGDEFVIILEKINNISDAGLIAKKIIGLVTQPFSLSNQEVFSGASIGISIFPNDGEDAQSLVKNADTAMYNVKEHGKNDFRFFTEKMNAKSAETLKLSSDLRRAIENNELVIYYQPQMDLKTQNIVGIEALVRWNHKEKGLVPPNDFIPFAEKSSLIELIGEWVLQNSCRQYVSWKQNDLKELKMSINISAKQLRNKNLIDIIQKTLNETGMNPNLIELELTESAIMFNADEAINIMQKLKDLGIGISIDDFGTGYSSLNYLKRFAIDKIKIDYTFIRDIETDHNNRAITKTIIELAHNLNLKAIAEGVETKGQLDFLVENNCDEAQGFYYYEPFLISDFSQLLKKFG